MNSGINHKLQISHQVQGRVRVKVPWLQGCLSKGLAFERYLMRERYVRSASIRLITGSVIIYFEAHAVDTPQLLLRLKSIMDELRAGVFSDLPCDYHTDSHHEQSNSVGSLRRGIFSVLAFSAFTLFFLFKRFVLKSPLSASWLVAASLLGSANLFYRALSDLRRKKLLSANTFLSAATLLAITTGEAVAAMEVIWIQELGQLLEDYIQDRSRRNVRELFLVTPSRAFVIVDGGEVETPITRIQAGDILAVRDTEKIPVDGKVVQGQAQVDEAHITGRAEPELRTQGDKVFAGTKVQQGYLQIEAQAVGDATYLAQVAHMVEASLSECTIAEKQADKLSSRLAVLGIGAGTATLLLTGNLAKTLAVQLALASPCATVLAASTAVSAALINASNNRVLIKGGPYLEGFASIDCICFDKTGTLTSNLPVVAEVIPRTADTAPEHILAMAAAAQHRSTHPIAKAIVQSAPRQYWPTGNSKMSTTILGRGVKTQLGDNLFTVGNADLMQDEAINIGGLEASASRLAETCCSVIYVARNGQAMGMIGIKYDVKPNASRFISQLRDDGITKLYLLSGDTQSVVAQTAKNLNLKQARGNMLPEDKAAYVARLVAKGQKVAMVGDGINDAPALAQAHIGIAMAAGGAEAAIEAADIALMDSELDRILFTRYLSRYTLRVIAQNHWFAVTTDLISVMLAMTGIFTPLLSGVAHIFHTLTICANSSRLLSFRPKDNGLQSSS